MLAQNYGRMLLIRTFLKMRNCLQKRFKFIVQTWHIEQENKQLLYTNESAN